MAYEMADEPMFVRFDRDNVRTLRLTGEIDLAVRDQLRDQVDCLFQEAHSPVCVDLTDVEFLDSSALGVLIAAHRARCRARRGPDHAGTSACGPPRPRDHGRRPDPHDRGPLDGPALCRASRTPTPDVWHSSGPPVANARGSVRVRSGGEPMQRGHTAFNSPCGP